MIRIPRDAAYRLDVDDDDWLIMPIRDVGVREVARRAGLSAAAVSLWIRGDLALPEPTARRIVEAAGMKWRTR